MFQPVTYSKTGLALHWDWNPTPLHDAATVLFKINRQGHATADSLLEYIQTHASRMIEDSPTIVGTGGWYVTMFFNDQMEALCSVTLMPYSVRMYLENKED